MRIPDYIAFSVLFVMIAWAALAPTQCFQWGQRPDEKDGWKRSYVRMLAFGLAEAPSPFASMHSQVKFGTSYTSQYGKKH